MANEYADKAVGTSEDPGINKYYESVATAFRYAKFIVLFVTVIFVMFILSFFRDEVSIENFQYMLKYITSEDSSLVTTQKIHYPTSDSKALDLFAGDFVSAGTGGISLYDTHGNTVLEIDDTFSDPVFAIGKKYALCYDLSGYSYVIFNTFSKLLGEESEFPIADAVMADNGSYAILTKDREYRTVINIHDSDYDLVSRVFKDKYTFDMDLSSKQLVYVTAEARDSSYLIELNALKLKAKEETLVAAVYDEFPLGVRFLGNNTVLITDKALRFYNEDHENISTFSFSSQIPGGFSVSDSFVLLYFEKNTIGSENEIKLYSKDGEFLFSTKLTGKVNSVDLSDEYAAVHTNDLLYRINISDRTIVSEKIETGAEKAMLQADSTVLVCYKNYAKLIDFSSAEEDYIKANGG